MFFLYLECNIKIITCYSCKMKSVILLWRSKSMCRIVVHCEKCEDEKAAEK